jgi:hypothetical protein
MRPLEQRTFAETVRLLAIERIARKPPDPEPYLRTHEPARHRLLARFRGG